MLRSTCTARTAGSRTSRSRPIPAKTTRFEQIQSANPDGESSISRLVLRGGDVLARGEEQFVDGEPRLLGRVRSGLPALLRRVARRGRRRRRRAHVRAHRDRSRQGRRRRPRRARTSTRSSRCRETRDRAGGHVPELPARAPRARPSGRDAGDAGSGRSQGEQEKLFWFAPGVGKVREENPMTGSTEELIDVRPARGAVETRCARLALLALWLSPARRSRRRRRPRRPRAARRTRVPATRTALAPESALRLRPPAPAPRSGPAPAPAPVGPELPVRPIRPSPTACRSLEGPRHDRLRARARAPRATGRPRRTDYGVFLDQARLELEAESGILASEVSVDLARRNPTRRPAPAASTSRRTSATRTSTSRFQRRCACAPAASSGPTRGSSCAAAASCQSAAAGCSTT